MHRITEPELMLLPEQVKAFASARKDYGVVGFLRFFKEYINLTTGKVVDLGTGSGHYLAALKDQHPELNIVGYDGSYEMVKMAESVVLDKAVVKHSLFENITDSADCVISSNTLHHVHDPKVFWDTVKRISNRCLVFDLVRPDTTDQAMHTVEFYAANEDELFKIDYYNSLLAAFSVDELTEQIKGTNLSIEIVSGMADYARCAIIHGTI